jgi:hypothetical protein
VYLQDVDERTSCSWTLEPSWVLKGDVTDDKTSSHSIIVFGYNLLFWLVFYCEGVQMNRDKGILLFCLLCSASSMKV